jgi:hypothetical protein
MRRVFADTFYWMALFSPTDVWHDRVLAFSRSVRPCRLYTTEEVLSEFPTFCSAAGPHPRQQAATWGVENLEKEGSSQYQSFQFLFRRLRLTMQG